jgi:hypothetical protein
MISLRRLGHDVIEFDLARFASPHRLFRSAQARWHPRFLLEELNRELEKHAIRTDGLECLWIDKGVWIFPETLRAVQRATGCRLIHYTPDSQIIVNRSKHFIESIPIYDVLITTKTFEVAELGSLGGRDVRLVPQSYCPVRFARPAPRAEFTHDVGFISDFKGHYGRIIRQLARSVPDIGVWGPRWRRAAWLRRVPARVVVGDGVWGADYVDALASFKIGLGLLSKYIPEQHTTRSFEIPAAGTFLLAERTEEHLALFEEGEEAEFFDSIEELRSKAIFYLENETTRRRVASRGRERCARSGYDNDSVLAGVVGRVS